MRILILGGTGFIGSWVTRSLAEGGSEVAVFHRGKTQAALPVGVREILGDRKAFDESRDALQSFRPNVVVDIALYTEGAAKAVVDLFRGHAGRLVVLSSVEAASRARSRGSPLSRVAAAAKVGPRARR